ncbi:MAG: Sua5/YciO/YrdC/YwlC family protein [Gammaproteobacteria bacterium]|nr:Sua5/YciO/YrdC/YwlC family protein [Gammaproteobacteria bacterium]MBT8150139.1 Sua5/YciO/YrdC/YwlC family protein [Gammaproteobacteria bacterium]NND40253.1 tRNA threonylcarbamoyladenosine biosynthesis protein RimN [Pseudomonadales bacterium]NNL10977.1 tRNA threonylcarbamoyladenosine biosynthesis protein RimN [Pseudomonadales bacterium]NNM11244.1 tRNA threonylcarbamoyladenosine biosynthesis protein RimN [Pseudomonadales bacterium]
MLQQPWRFEPALRALAAGEIIAYPTEAVWGLGCDPFNEHAVARLLSLKRRAQTKGLILVAAHAQQLKPLRNALSDAQWQKLCQPTEQATTWLVPNHGCMPPWICGVHDSVAVRLSSHPVVATLCQRFGDLLVSTSANPAGLIPARSERAARRYFRADVASYVSGATGGAAKPSRIMDLVTGLRLR